MILKESIKKADVSNTTVYKNNIATPAKPKAPGTTTLAPLLLMTTE